MEQLKFEQKNRPAISFVTEKGSVYTYLEDGRIERYKKVTDEHFEPSNAVVFIPNWEWVYTHAPKEFLEKFENELILNQELLSYIHEEGKKYTLSMMKVISLMTRKKLKMQKMYICILVRKVRVTL